MFIQVSRRGVASWWIRAGRGVAWPGRKGAGKMGRAVAGRLAGVYVMGVLYRRVKP